MINLIRILSFVLILISCSHLTVLAQLSHGTLPYSFQQKSSMTSLERVIMPAIDVVQLKKEDALMDDKEDFYRFGAEIPVDLSLNNAGQWEELPDGSAIWRLKIYAKEALSINLVYDDFYLPPKSKLHLYNEAQTEVLGAFTNANNKTYGRFATGMITGETTILEYFEPATVRGEGRIQVSTVVHGYRDFRRDYGDSGPCNINVNCAIGEGWEDQKQAVVLIYARGKRHCSGALVNNGRGDCTPYILSAKHCFPQGQQDVETAIFIFNYESPGCESQEKPTDQSITGAEILAIDTPSDFTLLELSQSPPTDYNAFYAGWSIKEEATDTVVCIHHPQGDIKKISVNYDLLTSDEGPTPKRNTHWRISEWELGTTERVSSGSPLFNTNKHIIGQLHGGEASCDEITEYDVFGKLAFSWNNDGAPINQRIRNFLDPNNQGIEQLEGQYCEDNQTVFAVDMSIAGLVNINPLECGPTNIAPQIELMNYGTDTIESVTFSIQINEESPIEQVWNGKLGYKDYETFGTLPIPIEEEGNYVLNVEIKSITQNNATVEDAFTANNLAVYSFELIHNQPLSVDLITDQYAKETAYEVVNQAGQVLYENSGFANRDTIRDDICLEEGCYVFKIYDSGADGICCIFGEGNYALSIGAERKIGEGGTFTDQDSILFCIQREYTEDLTANIVIDNSTFCPDEIINLQATTNQYAWVEWMFPDGIEPIESNQTSANIQINEVGQYELKLIASNGFDTVEVNKTLNIDQNIEFEIDLQSVSDDESSDGSIQINVSEGNPPYSYQWEHTNLDTAFVADLDAGTYSVTITDAFNCSVDSTFTLVYTSISTNDLKNGGIHIEQMTNGELIINHQAPTSEMLTATIFDINGRMMTTLNLYKGRNRFTNLPLTNGVYIIQVWMNEQIWTDKFVGEMR